MVLEGRIKSFNTWATAVEAAKEFWWQSWDSDLRVPTLESWDSDLRVPIVESWDSNLRVPTRESWESDLRFRTPERWDSNRRVPRPYRKVLTQKPKVLGHYRRFQDSTS